MKQDQREKEKGYVGKNIVSFTVDIDKVSNLLNQSINAGASRIDRVSFTATPEAIAKAKKKHYVKRLSMLKTELMLS